MSILSQVSAEVNTLSSPLVSDMFIAANTQILDDTLIIPGFSEMEYRCTRMKSIIRLFILKQLLHAKDYDEIHAIKVVVIDNDEYLRVVFTTIQGERLYLHLPCSPLRLLFWRKFFNAHEYTLLNGYISWQPYQLGYTEQQWNKILEHQHSDDFDAYEGKIVYHLNSPDYIQAVHQRNISNITCVNLIDKQPIRLFDFIEELFKDFNASVSSDPREIELQELRENGFELKNGTFCLVEKI